MSEGKIGDGREDGRAWLSKKEKYHPPSKTRGSVAERVAPVGEPVSQEPAEEAPAAAEEPTQAESPAKAESESDEYESDHESDA